MRLVRRAIAAFNERDIHRALDETRDDFEMDWSNSIGPLKGVYTGREEVLELWRVFLDAWEEVTWEPEEILELDDERLIVVNHVRMLGRGSGVPVEATGIQLWTITDGRGRKVKLYQSKADALDDVGLQKPAVRPSRRGEDHT